MLPSLIFTILAATTAYASGGQPAVSPAIARPQPDLGINCRGSSLCRGGSASKLVNYINGISGAGASRHYSNGEHIACTSQGPTTCAFLQNTPNGLSGGDVKNLAHYITDHGCSGCGSVPTGYPGSNDVSQGELTFNYVSSEGCGGNDGLCP